MSLVSSLAIQETSINDAIRSTLTKCDAVTYSPGQFTVTTNSNPFLTANNGNFVFQPSVCKVYVYCNGTFSQAIGVQISNFNSPDYTLLNYQTGELARSAVEIPPCPGMTHMPHARIESLYIARGDESSGRRARTRMT